MSEPKRMGDVVFDTLASMSLTIAGGPKLSQAIAQDINASRHAIVAEARRSRAREKRLEEALGELVAEMPGLLAPNGKVIPDVCICRSFDLRGACCHTRARAALSPSPVSARCPVCRAPAGQPHKMSCRPEERATKHYVESSPVSGETYRIGVDVGSPDGDRTVRVGWKQREDGTAEVVALRVEEPPVSGAAAKEPKARLAIERMDGSTETMEWRDPAAKEPSDG